MEGMSDEQLAGLKTEFMAIDKDQSVENSGFP